MLGDVTSGDMSGGENLLGTHSRIIDGWNYHGVDSRSFGRGCKACGQAREREGDVDAHGL